MWDLSNFRGEGKSTPINSYLAVMQEIHVLLVDHDPDGLINTSKLLEMCQYKGTVFELASAAITMLTNGKVKVDLVMANINSPDLHGFKLLQLAVNMDTPIILMSVDDNTFMAMRVIENGAFLYIKKPIAVEMLRCLWQHVAREKMRVMREKGRLMAANYSVRGVEFRKVVNLSDDHNPNYNMLMMKDNGKSTMSYYQEYDSDVMSEGKVKRKVCTEWTQELHEKFMDAVEELGQGRCFPKEILELMNVPGLTIMQVASHLQKCRNDNRRSPEERKAASNANPQSSDTDGSCQQNPRRFGSRPLSINSRSGDGSKGRPEFEMAKDGGNENMGKGGTIMAIATTYNQQQYGALVPHPSNDDYFCFQDIDSLIQNLSGVPEGSAGIVQLQPHSCSGGVPF